MRERIKKFIATLLALVMVSQLPGFEMVGMLNAEVKEAKERVRVALKNTGISIPALRITVNISPANLRKNGTAYDLPIAIALLIAIGIPSLISALSIGMSQWRKSSAFRCSSNFSLFRPKNQTQDRKLTP